ncbi:MAG TPA: zinc-ribbon domain-containing protein [Blastocatellia bacterium]|nr:zinc-ribbon domain-containing protein [Blastocatellia bacterium]
MPRFCTNCGQQLAEAAKFCNKCGTPVGGMQSQTPARPTVVTPAEPSVSQGAAATPPPSSQTQAWPPPSSSTQPQYTAPTTPQYQERYQMPPQNQPGYQQPVYQQQPYQTPASGGGLQQNIAGLLCYITFIPAIIFLVIEPYNKNRFIRFHAFQCLFLTAASFIINIAFSIFVNLLPGVLSFLVSLIGLLIPLIFLAIWILVIYKAYNNEMYKLPVIGDLAEQQAGR